MRVLGEVPREIGVLEVLEPIRHSEVAEVGDGCDAEAPHFGHRFIGKRPVVRSRAQVGPIVSRSPSQILETQLAYETEVLFEALVMAALFHFVDAAALAILADDDGIAVLDSRREEKRMRAGIRLVRSDDLGIHAVPVCGKFHTKQFKPLAYARGSI